MWKRDQQHTLPQRQGKRGGRSAADSLKKLTVEKGTDDGTRLMHAATNQENRRETIGKILGKHGWAEPAEWMWIRATRKTVVQKCFHPHTTVLCYREKWVQPRLVGGLSLPIQNDSK